MQVAVAEMAVRNQSRAGRQLCDQCPAFDDEVRQLAGRHRDVVLDARTFATLCFRYRLAQSPEHLALRFTGSKRGVSNFVSLHCSSELGFDALARTLGAASHADFQQDIPRMRLIERVARRGDVLQHQFECDARHELERRDRIAGERPQPRQQCDCSLRPRYGDKCSERPRRAGKEFARGCRDDSQRAFRADEQIAQVVTRVVLAQRLETVEHPAVGQHDFETEHEVAHHAVAQDGGAAGIRRQVAAELTRAFRAEAHRKQSIDRRCRRLDFGENATGFGDHRVIRRIERADATHACKRQHDLRAVAARRRSTAVTRVAADRHDADARLVAQLHDGRDLLGRVRSQHEGSGAVIQLAMIDEERLDIGRTIEIAVRSDHRAQAIQSCGVDAHDALIPAATSYPLARPALRAVRCRPGRRR